MTIDELNEHNERNHQKMMDKIDELREELNKIPIVIKHGTKPVEFQRIDFHQSTYDTVHFRGFGGKFAKALGFLIIVLQVLILWKTLTK